jgi:hypothetical protein
MDLQYWTFPLKNLNVKITIFPKLSAHKYTSTSPDVQTHSYIDHILIDMWKHKIWFDEGCSKLLDQRKQANLQWLQNPGKINWYNLNNVRRETSKQFRNKRREYLKDKINELAMNSKN